MNKIKFVLNMKTYYEKKEETFLSTYDFEIFMDLRNLQHAV